MCAADQKNIAARPPKRISAVPTQSPLNMQEKYSAASEEKFSAVIN